MLLLSLGSTIHPSIKIYRELEHVSEKHSSQGLHLRTNTSILLSREKEKTKKLQP